MPSAQLNETSAPTAPEASLSATLRADFFRYGGARTFGQRLRVYLTEPGARFTFWYRLTAALRGRTVARPIFILCWLIRGHYEVKYGFSIPAKTRIGPGLFFSHFGGIVVNGAAIIGRNCNISQGVTIGQSNRGSRKGCPRIGDNVFVGPGAKIFGAITIGSDVAIGANAVVLGDVPSGVSVGGIPAKIISNQGSQGYVEFTLGKDESA